jgi:hypothetical protein
VFKRSMYLRGVSCTFGGIGEVAVHPDYQRRGIATKLLEMSKQHMKTSPLYSQLPVTLSVLHTGTQAPLYEKSGWWNTLARTSFVCGTSTWTVTSADAPSEPESCFMLCAPNWHLIPARSQKASYPCGNFSDSIRYALLLFSTVFPLLSRLYEPNSGSILVDGKPSFPFSSPSTCTYLLSNAPSMNRRRL